MMLSILRERDFTRLDIYQYRYNAQFSILGLSHG
jgi:hypothetical protein